MKSLAMLAVTYDQDAPGNIEQWSVSGMRTLEGVEVGPWEGVDAVMFMGQFDVVVMWHWAPPDMVHILHHHNVEVVNSIELTDIKTAPEWCRINEELRRVLAGPGPFRRRSTLNRFGHPFVDAYENDPAPWSGKPHVWSIDVGTRHVQNVVREFLHRQWERCNVADRPDGLFIDSHGGWTYYGTATNAPASALTSWYEHDVPIAGEFAPVWGHSAGAPRMACANTIEEWALRDLTVGELARLMEDVWAEHRTITLCPNRGQADYSKLQRLRAMGYEPNYVQTARSGFYMLPEVRH